jgi:hypothetical protein
LLEHRAEEISSDRAGVGFYCDHVTLISDRFSISFGRDCDFYNKA